MYGWVDVCVCVDVLAGVSGWVRWWIGVDKWVDGRVDNDWWVGSRVGMDG